MSLFTLYCLYSGDAKYRTLIGAPALAFAALFMGGRKMAKANLNFITEMALHKDGKTVDILL